MTSETVVVGLDGLERLANDLLGGDPKRALLHSVARLGQLLASDSQGGEADTPDEHGVTAIDRAVVEDMAEQGGDGDWPAAILTLRKAMCCKAGREEVEEKLIRPFGYVPAPTQPSLSAEDRERLERIAKDVDTQDRNFQAQINAAREAAAFLRHLASAPPEDSGEKRPVKAGEGILADHPERNDAEATALAEAASPPEPQALDREVLGSCLTAGERFAVNRANDLQARLEKAQAAIQTLNAEAESKDQRITEQCGKRERVEAVLDELAAELEDRVKAIDSQKGPLNDWDLGEKAAHQSDAQLLREKQAALKGGAG